MLGTAYCPHCKATFHIDEAHLDTKQGLVRCGRCAEVFDFRINYVPLQPDPQLELPISDDTEQELDFTLAQNTETDTAQQLDLDIGHAISSLDEYHTDILHSENEDVDLLLSGDTNDIETLVPIEFESLNTTPPLEVVASFEDNTLAKAAVLKPLAMEAPPVEYAFAKKPYPFLPWAFASGLALLVLLLQAAYQFRVEFAARIPAIKPALVSICDVLNCRVTLPQNPDLMSIESSGLTDVLSHLEFTALLRNHASYAQAFPNLELTFIDTQDFPLSRRTFKPSEYLSPPENETTGLLPNHEFNIKLHLNTADIKPAGYRLVLIYPTS